VKYRNMKHVSVQIPESYLRQLDELVEKRRFPNRSEAIRKAILNLIIKYKVHPFKLKRRMLLG